jgi:hypothetical protein
MGEFGEGLEVEDAEGVEFTGTDCLTVFDGDNFVNGIFVGTEVELEDGESLGFGEGVDIDMVFFGRFCEDHISNL